MPGIPGALPSGSLSCRVPLVASSLSPRQVSCQFYNPVVRYCLHSFHYFMILISSISIPFGFQMRGLNPVSISKNQRLLIPTPFLLTTCKFYGHVITLVIELHFTVFARVRRHQVGWGLNDAGCDHVCALCTTWGAECSESSVPMHQLFPASLPEWKYDCRWF